MKMNHLGFVTRDLGQAIRALEGMGFTKVHPEPKHHVPKNMHVQRVEQGGLVVEVMATADTSKPSFVGETLDATTQPYVLQHVCYDVDDIHQTVDRLLATGEYTVHEAITDGVFQKNKICFLRHRHLGLVEFFEWPK